ncbi:hypothetical protein P691DRAFT_764197 [Macrolepiota fuliginosa MF-IS2]|uniref:Uncharacterized protein n=1 Tax=Macrolepiota fuliginosa MF-IS2 TaxID=1400762 RepID=A0A9P5X4J9_9AGAR|nr:hypothetical protein P691DRAFT_764197 [Macrolepiota fuliginosa MF-IS2]
MWKEYDIWSADVTGSGVWDMLNARENGDSEQSSFTEWDTRRKRKTHTPDVTDILRNLPLSVKLQENYDIEQRNFAKFRKQVQHRRDPAAFPDDASSIELFITIGSDERSILEHPRVSGMVGDRIPFYLRLEMAVNEKAAFGADGTDAHLHEPGRTESAAGSPRPRGAGFFGQARHIVIHNPVMVENNHHSCRPSPA